MMRLILAAILAAAFGVAHAQTTSASSTSVAGAVASGNGGGFASTHTSGWQKATATQNGISGNTGPWNLPVQGSVAAVDGSAATSGQAKSATIVLGNAAAGSATWGSSDAYSRGSEYASTPKTSAGASGYAVSENSNKAYTAGAFFYFGAAVSKSGAGTEYDAYGAATHVKIGGYHADGAASGAGTTASAQPNVNFSFGIGFGFEGAYGGANTDGGAIGSVSAN